MDYKHCLILTNINHSVHRDMNPPQKYHSLFLAKPPLNLQSFQPPFLGNPSLLINFLWTSPPKSWIFRWVPRLLKFFILNPTYLLKVTKLLVEISQFEFLVMAEKNIFVYKLFLLLNISDFGLFFFFCKNCNIPEKSYPFFSSNPSKLRSCPSPPFWKFGRRFNPPSRKWGGGGRCTLWLTYMSNRNWY